MLMKLLELYLRNEFGNMVKKDVVYRAIGDRAKLPENIQTLIAETEQKTRNNQGMRLVSALSYGSRDEIVGAVRKLVRSGAGPDDVTEERISGELDTAGLPDPDLIIRTSGERRLSNFLLWQSAYAELYFTETLWPDFDREEFMLAIRDYQGRERRFGRIAAQDI